MERRHARIHKRRLEAELDRILALTPVHPAGVKWKATIEKLRPNLLVFMTNRAVPPTNNESERSLRPCATYRKITNGFRSQWGANQYADIRSVIETGRRQSIVPLGEKHDRAGFACGGESLDRVLDGRDRRDEVATRFYAAHGFVLLMRMAAGRRKR